ncbi:MAG: hypothetical protein JSU77_10290 [Fidelibacterota bacterium]|nr:MAG: hypothetical protein JSU77_10290 [Candidatus Neomarinimicrobiota bacterium]
MRHYLPVCLLITGALSAQVLPGQEQGARLTSGWSADTVHIGEPVILRLEVDLPAGSVPHFAEVAVTSPGASLDQTRLEPMAVEYTFTFWELGRVMLPGIPVKIVAADGAERVIQTDSLSILVASVLTGQEHDIREIKGMIPVILRNPRSFWFRTGLAAVLVVVIALLWWSRRRLTGPAQAAKDEVLQPDDIATRALGKLSVGKYRPALASEYYLELSRLLRRYLEQRFLFRALEMTTSEIKDLLPGELDDPGTAALIGQVLEQSDLAKFADQHHPTKAWREDLRRVAAIIDRTRPEFRV